MRKYLYVFLAMALAACGLMPTPASVPVPVTLEVVTLTNTGTATSTPTATPTLNPTQTVDPMVNCNLEGIQAAVDESIGEDIFIVTGATIENGNCSAWFTYMKDDYTQFETWSGESYEYKLRAAVPGNQVSIWTIKGNSGNFNFVHNSYGPQTESVIGLVVNGDPYKFITRIELRQQVTPTLPTLAMPASPTLIATPTP